MPPSGSKNHRPFPGKKMSRPRIKLEERLGLVQAMRKSSLMAVVLDLYGTVKSCNQEFLRRTGWTKEEVAGMNWFDNFIPPEEREGLHKLYRQTILDGKFPQRLESRIQTRFSEPKSVSWTHSAVQDKGGRICGLICVGLETNEPDSGKKNELVGRAPDSLPDRVQPSSGTTCNPEIHSPKLDSDQKTTAGDGKPADRPSGGEERNPSLCAADKADKKEGKYLTFSLGGGEYGIPVHKVREIIKMVSIHPIPRAPLFVKGVINLRGLVIPVIDLRRKFGLDELDYGAKACIIILETQKEGVSALIGIVVDSVTEVLNIKNKDIIDAPPLGFEAQADFILGMTRIDEKIRVLLHMDKIVDLKDGCFDL
jgi:purine-binding chemotaxis protein CheW